MKPTIKKVKFLTFYNAPNFSLTVTRAKSDHNFLTFQIGDDSNYQFTSVTISRKEAAHALKNFKKVLAKSRQKA